MKKRQIVFVILCFLFYTMTVSGQTEKVNPYLNNGKLDFKNKKYESAVVNFEKIINSPGFDSIYGEAFYWIIQSHLAMGNYALAEKNIETFLINFQDNPFYEEVYYLKGRLLFLQREYEKALQLFYQFLKTYPASLLKGNGYFWIGESLYNMGQFDQAAEFYKTVVQHYPESFKAEPAQYRLSLIELHKRETELLKFLKWSHEEALKTLDEFQLREKSYEQALGIYQKKLAEKAGGVVSADTAQLQKEIQTKNQEIQTLKKQIEQLKARLTGQSATEDLTNDQVSANGQAVLQEQLSILKAKANSLKKFYEQWLEANTEQGQ